MDLAPPHGHHMAVRGIGVQLRFGRTPDRGAAATLSDVSAPAHRLGWLLTLVAGTAGGRADLDSARSVRRLSTIARTAAGSATGATAGRGDGDWDGDQRKGGGWAGVAADHRAAGCAAYDAAHLVGTLSRGLAKPAERVRAMAVSLSGAPVDLRSVGERAALEALDLAWQRAMARFGVQIGGASMWAFWSRLSGGLALGTHTTSPWAASPGADWMRASPSPGGPGP